MRKLERIKMKFVVEYFILMQGICTVLDLLIYKIIKKKFSVIVQDESTKLSDSESLRTIKRILEKTEGNKNLLYKKLDSFSNYLTFKRIVFIMKTLQAESDLNI